MQCQLRCLQIKLNMEFFSLEGNVLTLISYFDGFIVYLFIFAFKENASLKVNN